MDGFVGEIKIFSGITAPQNWNICDGSLLSIQQYNALFSIIGTTYGGDGQSNFAIPDLRGRVPIGAGQGNNLSLRLIGDKYGTETNTITVDQMPAHIHAAAGVVRPIAGTGKLLLTNDPANNYTGQTPSGCPLYTSANNARMGESPVDVSIDSTGGGNAVNNMPPFQCVNYIICLNGLFPTGN